MGSYELSHPAKVTNHMPPTRQQPHVRRHFRSGQRLVGILDQSNSLSTLNPSITVVSVVYPAGGPLVGRPRRVYPVEYIDWYGIPGATKNFSFNGEVVHHTNEYLYGIAPDELYAREQHYPIYPRRRASLAGCATDNQTRRGDTDPEVGGRKKAPVGSASRVCGSWGVSVARWFIDICYEALDPEVYSLGGGGVSSPWLYEREGANRVETGEIVLVRAHYDS